jgi:phage shock protein A
MAEVLSKRISRLFFSGIEGAVDRLEIASNENVMRETIREVDRAIDLVQADYEAVVTRRLHAVRQQRMLRARAVELEEKAMFALGEDRADLAEAALVKQVDCETEDAKLDTVQAACQGDETRLAENLAALKARKDDMAQALADFLEARRNVALGGDGATRVPCDIETQVRHAEQAFGRALQGAGGVDVAHADADVAHRIAEIDVMRKRATVASRLASLREGLGKTK